MMSYACIYIHTLITLIQANYVAAWRLQAPPCLLSPCGGTWTGEGASTSFPSPTPPPPRRCDLALPVSCVS